MNPFVWAALGWGVVAASSPVGAGALVSAVGFELVEEGINVG